MLTALKKWGTLTPAAALAGAIELAEQGYAADDHYVESSKEIIEWIRAEDSATKAWLVQQEVAGHQPLLTQAQLAQQRMQRFAWLWDRMLKQGNVRVGDRIELPEKAALLKRIAEFGDSAFYEGACAEAIVRATTKDAGVLTLRDLASYSVREREPFVTQFQGKRVLSMPPPSSGGIVLSQVLAMLEARRDDLARIASDANNHNGADALHLLAECCKHAFADRAHYLGDTDFVPVELAELLNKDALVERAASIDLTRTQAQETYGSKLQAPALKGGGTSHLCVVDEAGNAVCCTETINLVFGSLVAVPEFGFILNDTMDDFLTRANTANAFGLSHAERNRPEPGKRPLSAMTPTIVLDADEPSAKPMLLAGASGGPRIISGTLQAMLNMLVWRMPAWDAVARPRMHHQWSPHTLQLEDGLFGTSVQRELEARGHEVSRRQPVAAVQVMVKRGSNHGECAGSEFEAKPTQRSVWQAASDPRKGGAPAGE
jgi:gamma-glutamyltranspeptidase/glutathione hydrolase